MDWEKITINFWELTIQFYSNNCVYNAPYTSVTPSPESHSSFTPDNVPVWGVSSAAKREGDYQRGVDEIFQNRPQIWGSICDSIRDKIRRVYRRPRQGAIWQKPRRRRGSILRNIRRRSRGHSVRPGPICLKPGIWGRRTIRKRIRRAHSVRPEPICLKPGIWGRGTIRRRIRRAYSVRQGPICLKP